MWEFGERYRSRVAALPNTIENQRYSDMVDQWPEDIPRIAATAEQILFAKPDLVILAGFNNIALRDAVTKLNVPYLLLEDFTGFDGYKKNIRKIAASVKAVFEGEKIIEKFEDRLRKIQLRAYQNPVLRQLNCLSYSYGYFAGARTSLNDMIQAAGLKNIAADKGVEGIQKGSQEKILLWNPDVLVIGCQKGSCKRSEETVKKRLPLLRHTRAFKNGLIIAIDDAYLTSIDENMLRASEILQERIQNTHIKYER